MIRVRLILFVIVGVLSTTAARATTFVVPPDDWLISRADAIVVGTITRSESRIGRSGLIETVHTLRIDDSLKGDESTGGVIEVTEQGGRVGDAVLVVSGSPTYRSGDRYLVFLRRVGDRWVTFDFLIGKFEFVRSAMGEELLVREERLESLSGEAKSARGHRIADEFIATVKEVVRQDRNERSLNLPLVESEQESGDLRLAAQVATGSWSGDEFSTIRYTSSTSYAAGDEAGDDGEDRVIADDPHDLIPGTMGADSSVLAVAIYGCSGQDCLPADNQVRGELFSNITWSDVVLNDLAPGVVLNQALLDTVVTHEIGHTLGLRHSDRVKNDPESDDPQYDCIEPMPCSDYAVMRAAADETLNGILAIWDKAAANAVYGDGSRVSAPASEYVNDMYVESLGAWVPVRRSATKIEWKVTRPPCAPVAILEQPSSITVAEGASVTLTVEASGRNLEYRWFEGPSGDTSRLVGTDPELALTSMFQTAEFWVLVLSQCEALPSETATVTVRPACLPDQLCALDNRFHISLAARDQRTARTGRGEPTSRNNLFGYFSLPELTGDAENPEVFVKMLDGREVNGEFWVFYGGLTDLEYTLSVEDSDTGELRTYHKPAGSTAGGFDVGQGVTAESCSAEVDGVPTRPTLVPPCTGEADELCLGKTRFRVEITARDQRTGTKGVGEAIPQNDLSGYFSLPALTGNPGNPEVFVKVLDGRGVNGHFWVFFSGLTDLEYTVTVSDVVTGVAKSYLKPPGSACGAFDTNAF